MFRFKRDKNLVNISSSVLKHFNVIPYHSTYEPLDALLNNNRNKKVVLFLFDGLGKEIIKKHKDKAKFIYKNRFKTIHSVFPPTTVACTTSLLTGLYPSETGHLGWWTRIGENLCTSFISKSYYNDEIIHPTVKEILPYKNIIELINEQNDKDLAKAIYSFELPSKNDIKCFVNKVDEELKSHDFIYAYFAEPDSTMHVKGTEDEEVSKMIESINDNLKEFCLNHKDIFIISLADHGMIDSVPVEVPVEFLNIVDGVHSIEARAAAFRVKKEDQQKFIDMYNRLYKHDFELYTAKEVIDKEIFGPAERRHQLFEHLLGDFVMISTSNKYFPLLDSFDFKGLHGGGTKLESEIILAVYNEDNSFMD